MSPTAPITKALTLYEVEDSLQAYLDTESDVPENMQAEFQAALSAAGSAALDKRDACIRAFQVIDSQIEFIKAEKKRLGERQTVLENGLKRFRRYLASVLQQLPAPKKGAPKLEGRIGTISLRKGSESVEIPDPSKINPALCSLTITLPAHTWFLAQQMLQSYATYGDPAVMAVSMAVHGAPYEIIPDKARVREYLEEQIAQEAANSFDLAVADDADKPAILAAIAEAVYTRCGARIKTGEPTVVVK